MQTAYFEPSVMFSHSFAAYPEASQLERFSSFPNYRKYLDKNKGKVTMEGSYQYADQVFKRSLVIKLLGKNINYQ